MENKVKNIKKFFESKLFDWEKSKRRRGIRPTDIDLSYEIDGKFFCTGDGKEIGKPIEDDSGQRRHYKAMVERTSWAQQKNPDFYEVIFYYEHPSINFMDYINDLEKFPFHEPTKCYVTEYIDSDSLKWQTFPMKMNINQAMDYFENYWEETRFPQMVKQQKRLRELAIQKKNGK